MEEHLKPEFLFFQQIKNKINVIFDVGARDYSLYLDSEKEVHYFEPNNEFLIKLTNSPNKNTISKFNNFGLSDIEESILYHFEYESFLDRSGTLGRKSLIKEDVENIENHLIFNVKTAKDYIISNNIKNIDFLKIDTEGYEFKVIKGFGEYIDIVNIVQFEYGGTYLDANLRLIDVISYLKSFGFNKFFYLIEDGLSEINNFTDHYQYSNIVCFKNVNDYINF